MVTPTYLNGRFLTQPQSGVQRFAVEITAALARIWPSGSLPRPTLLLPAGAEVASPLPVRRVGRRRGVAWEQLELPRHVADGVLVNLGNTGPLRVRRQVVVIHDTGVFGSPDAYSWQFRAWYKLLQRGLVRRGARIATVSEFSRTEILRHLGTPAVPPRVLPEGADHMHRIAADTSVLQQHGLEPGRFVLAVGNLAAHKNLAALGETARALDQRGLPLVITGGLDAGVFSARRTPLPQPARYVGRVSDEELRGLYGTAACFVFPSLYEGYGLPVIEAMACGCPVVASSIPALREVCRDAALFCDPLAPEDIARQVCRVLDEPGLSQTLRQDGSRLVESLTWDAAAGALLELIRGASDPA